MEANGVPKLGRRALLAAGAAGVAAAAAQAVAPPAVGAIENAVLLGVVNNAGSVTTVVNTASGHRGSLGTDDHGVLGLSTAGLGVGGHSATNHGIEGSSDGADRSGVHGYNTNANGYGVRGENQATGCWGGLGTGNQGVFGSGSDTHDGVWGRSSGPGKSGVLGLTASKDGWGVFGKNDGSGTSGALGSGSSGVWGYAVADQTHFALAVEGRATFSRSGLITINKGQDRAHVSAGSGLHPSAMVLATLQTYCAGVYIAAAIPHINDVWVYLNKKAPKTVKVAFFILN